MVSPRLIALLLAAVFPVPSYAADSQGTHELIEYGTRTSATISVTVIGEAVRRPGIYHIEPNTSFPDLMKRAEWLRTSTGRFIVTRMAQGKKTTLTIRMDEPEFRLQNGDTVYAPSFRKP